MEDIPRRSPTANALFFSWTQDYAGKDFTLTTSEPIFEATIRADTVDRCLDNVLAFVNQIDEF
jgi:hypothetical protein